MKRRIVKTGLLIVMMGFTLDSGALVDTIGQAGQKLGLSGDKIFVTTTEKRQKELAEVAKEREEFLKDKEEIDKKIKTDLEEIKGQRDQVQAELKVRPDDEYLKKKLSILNENNQVLNDLKRLRDQILVVLDDFIRLLTEFLGDPEFVTYKKEKVQDRLFYSFEDLQKLYEQVHEQEKRLEHLTEQEKNAQAELENRTRNTVAIREAYKKKKKELATLSKAEDATKDEALTVQLAKDLINLEQQLYTNKTTFYNLLEKEMEYKIGLLSLQLSIARSHRGILKEHVQKIKSSVRVSKADIADAQEKLTVETQSYDKAKEEYRREREKISSFKDKKEEARASLAKKYGVTLDRELDDWSREPQQTVDSYLGYCEVGAINSELLALQTKLELLDAQSTLEDEKIIYERLEVQVKQSYHKINTRKSAEEIAQELKKYDAPKAEANAALAKYKEKINTVSDQLSSQKKVLDNIQQRRESLQKLKNTIFKIRVKEFARCVELLGKAEAKAKEKIDLLSKLTGIYSGIIATVNATLRLIRFISGELEAITIWYRPEGAITWQGMKNIVPDMAVFFADVHAYVSRFNMNTVFERIKDSFREPLTLLFFILKLLAALIGLLLFRRYFTVINKILLRIGEEYGGLVRIISLLLSALISFVYTYFVTVALWILLFAMLLFQLTSDPYIYILFYLLSILYLLYLANRFIRFMIQFNVRYNYVFLTQDFQRRFVVVLSSLLYASTVIFFFRHAFMLANYFGSELPTILLAINFIIFQISLILLIDKEQILSLISNETPFWQWIYKQVDAYYYLILFMIIAIIIMSNPYVGFSRLVLYTLFGLIYSGLMIVGLFWLHGFFKRIASRIFFATSDEVVRERFPNAKTSFGLLIIISFIIVGFLGLIIGARIWGWQITFDTIKAWFKQPIMGTEENPITMLSFVRIIGFIFMGFLVAYWLRRFVLEKIFDLLLIDAGVQHTVTSITQYVVIVVAIFFGFKSAGLDFIVNIFIGALILGLGYILKEPIGDFVAYFIILVQRPVKIGDYVKIDNETMGVVRKITARSIVLRRKNSTTIIVPNSYVINRSIVNWNYTRNFIAFDDILVTIAYKEDPEQVKQLLLAVVEAHPNILKNPRPIVRLQDFGEYGYVFLIRGFLSSAYSLEQWNTASDIRFTIIKELQANNIQLALPVRMIISNSHDVFMKKKDQ